MAVGRDEDGRRLLTQAANFVVIEFSATSFESIFQPSLNGPGAWKDILFPILVSSELFLRAKSESKILRESTPG
jgi:hypothetical protein